MARASHLDCYLEKFTLNQRPLGIPLYYVGNFPLYEPIAEANRNGLFNSPIYVGKAVPSGARKGGYEKSAEEIFEQVRAALKKMGDGRKAT